MDLKEIMVGIYIYFLNAVSARELYFVCFSIDEEISNVIFLFFYNLAHL